MGASGRIGRLLAIGVIGVAALLVLGLLPDDEAPQALGTSEPETAAARREVPVPERPQTPAAVLERQYQTRLAARIMFVRQRSAAEGGAVYPMYPAIHDATFAAELRDAFVPMSAMFDTTTLFDAIDRTGAVSPMRIDPLPNADSLLRNAPSNPGSPNIDLRFDVHGSLAGRVAPDWIVALAQGAATPLPLTPWGQKGRERATNEGRRLALLVSDDTVAALKYVPFRVVSYDRFDLDSARYVVVHAVRESARHPGDVEAVGEMVTLIGQSLGGTDEFAPVWSSDVVSPVADMTLAPIIVMMRIGSAKRPVLLVETQPGDDACNGDRRGNFVALMDDGRWHPVGFWGPGC
jgi:hypothetical protein